MKNKRIYTDIHCHPLIKPYGRSYDTNINNPNPKKRTSIWYRKRPDILTRLLNRTTTLTKFTQSDFKTLIKGKVFIVCTSISPIEKGFFVSNLGTGPVTDLLADFVTGIGLPKINFIQKNKNYYSELLNEYKYLNQLNGKIVRTGLRKSKYSLIRTYNDFVSNKNDLTPTISVLPTIEGLHVLLTDNTQVPQKQEMIENVQNIKNWEYKPLFISAAHHFYNYMCGHAYSLGKTLGKLLNQEDGVNTGFTETGKAVIEKLLDNTDNKRIFIDIKHMSRKSRREYYKLLEETPAYSDVPIIVSHGGVNGRPTVYSDDEHDEDNGLFNGSDVNFYDDEIILIGESCGLFGIQLDERRSGSKNEIKKTRNIIRRLSLIGRSGLIWNQIEHIAKTLDNENLPAWDIITIGSDYDGMIDPLNGFWTSKQIRLMAKFLKKHANKFLNQNSYQFNLPENGLTAHQIVEKIFSGNLINFLSKTIHNI